MTEKEIIAKIQELVGDLFEVKGIHGVNHKPHPYMIGQGHIRNNILNEDEIRRLEKAGLAHCYQTGCRVPYDEHTNDRAIFLGMVRTLTNKEAYDALYQCMQILESEKIAGFVFVRGDEKHIIEPPLEKEEES